MPKAFGRAYFNTLEVTPPFSIGHCIDEIGQGLFLHVGLPIRPIMIMSDNLGLMLMHQRDHILKRDLPGKIGENPAVMHLGSSYCIVNKCPNIILA